MENFKIIYKILRELEKNMGNENFSVETISAEKLKVPFDKWEQLLILMQEDGYIKGLVLLTELSKTYQHIVEPMKPKITIKGLEYLTENPLLKKAEDMIKGISEIRK